MAPSDEVKRQIYQFYKLIYESNFTFAKKKTLMTAALGMEEWSWRVVGISKNAVIEIAKNNYKKPAKKLARDHQVTRAETYAQIFGTKEYEFNDWWNLVWENDKTTLITNEEHSSHVISEIYPIDLGLGLFRDSGMVGWKHVLKNEGAFIKSLCEKHKITY